MDSRFGSPIRSRRFALWLSAVLFAWQSWCNAQSSVLLTWSASVSPNIVGYNIYYGSVSGSYTNEISTGNVTNLTISGLVTGDTYYFAAASVNSSGIQSPLSTQVSCTPQLPVPSLTITNVTSGMRVTNSAFTAMGIASDSVAVADVYYSFNGAAYTTASLDGNQWTASLALAAGTNTLAAYAVDVNNTYSATDTVSIVYTPMGILAVQTNGEGIINPNYNGSWLQVGAVYTLTATPINGFAFTNWTGSANGTQVLSTNGQTVQFTMLTNLVMQANFVDTNKPFISITNITAGMHVTNGFTAMGLATDNVAVASVQYSLNGGSFVSATINGKVWSSAPLSLIPGTNTLAVYATDTSGNLSATATVNFDDVLSATLAVQTNGDGIINPNYNGSSLAIGADYSMTATPINGFAFTNWSGSTNGVFTIYTNGPTIQFTMFSNLVMQANFVDTNKPFVSITNVPPGMEVSNGIYTVMGLATDNVAVANVQYSLNGGSFAPAAITGNVWSSGPLSLNPGSNSVAVYATDTSGNVSTTATAIFDYVLSATLTVQTNGEGVINPNLNGALLQIGAVYTMTATPINGFAFTNWTGSANGTQVLSTNGQTVQFTMLTNLVMQANFVDTNKPFVSITNLSQGMQVSNANVTVMGIATDNVAVASVQYSLNGGSFVPATIAGNVWSSALLSLIPGTNALSVYAMDTSGNLSATDTVSFDYVVSATLAVQTNGDGFINPNYNGSLLQIGRLYTMTATPTNGFAFTNWSGSTNGAFTIYTNGPTVQFTMFSNLVMQANFVDTNPPFISITNVRSGLEVSNGTITVMGLATDNVAVASVQYSLNSGSFVAATIAGNVWSSAPLSLNPGSNSVAVYATDTSGNVSATDTVIFDYVVSATLTVQTNGEGMINPNLNGALLQIGAVYTMTATPTNGFAFTNWTGSTSGTFTVYTNGPTVQFTMLTNLVMQANFVDTNKPFVNITNLSQGMQVSNADITVMGVATDNVAVASVQYSLNGGSFVPASITGNVWYSALLSLIPGTNALAVYAMDTSGNLSATDTVSFDYVVSATLAVQTNGDGFINPNYNGSLLQIGRLYTMTATPTNGFAFTNWSGSTNGTFTVYTNGPTVQFTMFSNLVMQANFVDTNKPFVSITNVPPGMEVSNGIYTVMGLATDNVAVANVQYSLNGGSFAPAAIIGNVWSSGPLSLNPGSNSVAVYATDTSGNVSTTATAIFDYVLSATLTVQTNGEGMINPNYNGSWLQLGAVYTMTATPTNGFAFTNWTGSTGGTFTLYTNSPTVQFTMLTNLVMQANFVDTNAPFISITNISQGMQVTNGTFTAMGLATDNVAVADIYYSLNGASFAPLPTKMSGNVWYVQLSLVPGTNTLAAYAVDSSGNVSATDTVNFDYAVSAGLIVQTNGDGFINPNYNGSLLQIGAVYTMTATPTNGFAFTNWSGSTDGTNGPFTVYTNGPTVQFTMLPNLVMQANFADTNAPFVSINNITPGMQLGVGSFNVLGVATDNVAVASVQYSLNCAPFTPASITNNTWTASLVLVAGTNTLAAYAVDTSGNVSATAVVAFDYVVLSRLTVQTTGEGTVNPDYNGLFLNIGTTYSMTAVGTNGFGIGIWIGSTNGVQVLSSSNQTVQFTMLPNLVLQGNFVDVTPPFISITNVPPGLQVSNSDFTVMGVATDNVAVASVEYSLNDAPFVPVALTNEIWSVDLSLSPGTNTIAAYATDAAGNISATNIASVDYFETGTLTVKTNGKGNVGPNLDGQKLRLGQKYSMSATAASGFVFTNWMSTTNGTLAVYTNAPTVQFTMLTNLVMQANFKDTVTPYLAITNATSGMVWTNPTFTVMGVATDDEALASINYSFNGAPYAEATTNGIEWSAGPLSLTLGTNVFSVYAQATNGNLSVTDTVDLVYAVSNMMTVETNGNGIISPNYNGQSLRIGENYSISATPASGFIFTNWSIGLVGDPLTVYTNKATAVFSMADNLEMQANFVDTLKPYLKITNAVSGMLWTNPTYTVMGLATDDEAVASVNFSLNGSAYAPAATNGIQWNTGPLALLAGTNVFSVYAQATNGNLSVTDTVDLVYAVSNMMTVETNGKGMISPNYNGQSLRIGENYSISATPASGFIFTNWSIGLVGNPLTVYTNKSTAVFEMATNLEMQANFVDTLKPYLKVTNAVSGMLWTNPTYTVMGVATDDEAVASVNFSLNGSAYSPAATNGIQWNTGPLALLAGTNVFSVYAQATNGNLSVTDTVDLVYAVSNMMTVETNGKGMISPNYNGQSLRIGENYSISATPASGFIFTNWSIGLVGNPLTVYTNKSTAVFEMATNLEMQANFVDTMKPYLKVTNAVSGMLWTNPTFTVMGVATDDEAVASVNFSLNGSVYSPAATDGIQWNTGPLALLAGTNVFDVYVQATNGNLSATDTVDLVYAVSNIMTVETNGKGMISPNYNGQSLRIGENYNISATPASGFIFTNWSIGLVGNPLTVYTNKSTAVFEMATNLEMQANFVDMLKPYLKVTNAVSGMLWTNPTFTVMGVATDDEAVASVNFSLNGSAYSPAATNGIQWNTGPLALLAGTNVFDVYVQATNGNLSVTDTVDLVYAVSNIMTVETNGKGMISPNYNGQSLRIGENYSISATPASGFIFTNWSIGLVGNPLTVYTNKSTAVFEMATNLEMQANFVDTLKPYLKVTNAVSGMLWTNPTYTVMGVATDDEAVASVNFSLNGSAYAPATTNGIQWSAGPLTLMAGTNIFAVYAQATNGNFSATNTISLVYVVSNQLVIESEGLGTLSPNYSNAWLRVGQNYSMTAWPASGFIFTNWVISTNFIGGVTTNKPTLQFMMATNLTLQANFAETARPALTILSPASGTQESSPIATVTGTAKDIWGVAAVAYELNGGPWTNVVTTNGFTNWTATVELSAGTNVLSAFAMNLGGNYSTTNTLSIISTGAAALQFGLSSPRPNGHGFNFDLKLSPGLSGHIEVSTNLIDWNVLTNFTDTNGVMTIYDPDATAPQKFYRAVVP